MNTYMIEGDSKKNAVMEKRACVFLLIVVGLFFSLFYSFAKSAYVGIPQMRFFWRGLNWVSLVSPRVVTNAIFCAAFGFFWISVLIKFCTIKYKIQQRTKQFLRVLMILLCIAAILLLLLGSFYACLNWFHAEAPLTGAYLEEAIKRSYDLQGLDYQCHFSILAPQQEIVTATIDGKQVSIERIRLVSDRVAERYYVCYVAQQQYWARNTPETIDESSTPFPYLSVSNLASFHRITGNANKEIEYWAGIEGREVYLVTIRSYGYSYVRSLQIESPHSITFAFN